MKKLEVPADYVYQFRAPKKLVKLGIEIAESVDYSTATVNSGRMELIPLTHDSKPLNDWFEECLEEVRKDLGLECTKIHTTLTWCNRAQYKEWHNTHVHSNSLISGIFYLTDSSARTWLSGRNHWFPEDTALQLKDPNSMDNLRVLKVKTEPGVLILFPSNMPHSVSEHDKGDPRYTISFNSYPSGVMGNTRLLSYVNMDVSHHTPV